MTAATINKINSAIAKYGVHVFKGNGYFYFFDIEGSPSYNADRITSVYSPNLRCMPLESWIDHVESALR